MSELSGNRHKIKINDINALELWDFPNDERERYLELNGEYRDELARLLVKKICSSNLFYIGEDGRRAKKAEEFDGLAFTKALKKAVPRFDKSRASFTTYFKMLYEQAKKENFYEESDINITRDVVRLAEDVQNMHQDLEISYSAVIDLLKEDEAYKSYSEGTWIKVKWYLEGGKYGSLNNVLEDDEGESLDIEVEDPNAEKPYNLLDDTEEFISITLIAKEKLSSANDISLYKMYITMLIMKELKGGADAYIEVQPAGDEDYYNALSGYEVELKNEIFNRGYIKHVIKNEPVDIDQHTLYGAYNNFQIRDINQKSIAEFSSCSSEDITQRLNRLRKKIN